jgi:hypothetical protein
MYKDNKSPKITNNSIGFTGALTLVFITLKLLGEITWSWWWVLSPIWISGLFVVVLFALFWLLVWWIK